MMNIEATVVVSRIFLIVFLGLLSGSFKFVSAQKEKVAEIVCSTGMLPEGKGFRI